MESRSYFYLRTAQMETMVRSQASEHKHPGVILTGCLPWLDLSRTVSGPAKDSAQKGLLATAPKQFVNYNSSLGLGKRASVFEGVAC